VRRDLRSGFGKTVAIIPARGGSKGIPGKNLADLGGLPLVCHSIRVAAGTKMIDEIVVTSDCCSILNAVNSYNPRVRCIIRPAHLATDDASTESALLHSLEELAREQRVFETLLVLQPTSPFRLVREVEEALRLFQSEKTNSLISVSDPTQQPADFINYGRRSLSYISRPPKASRRQEFPPALFINGALYVVNVEYFLSTGRLYDLDDCAVYKMQKVGAIDIDDRFDLEIARAMMNYGMEKFYDCN
jgi:CMP-N,N'-diacetyllegionaminic acid synthase